MCGSHVSWRRGPSRASSGRGASMRDAIAIILVLSACGTPDGPIVVDAPVVLDAPAADARSPDGRPPPDAPLPDAPLALLTCKELSVLAQPLMDALDRSCSGDGDCEI